jgi:hypothetical protein
MKIYQKTKKRGINLLDYLLKDITADDIVEMSKRLYYETRILKKIGDNEYEEKEDKNEQVPFVLTAEEVVSDFKKHMFRSYERENEKATFDLVLFLVIIGPDMHLK